VNVSGARDQRGRPDAAGTGSPGGHGPGSLLRRFRGSTAVKRAARTGLVARGLFYLLLAGLAVSLLVGVQDRAGQANANGALSQVAQAPAGIVLLVGAATGFLAFGLIRLAGAATDDRHGGWRRLSTAGQGLLYLGMATATAAFVLGSRGTGSEQQQRTTARTILALPGGRLLLAVAGLVVIAMCGWQLLVAARGHFRDTLHEEEMGRKTQRWTTLAGRVGIPARALAVLPVGVFLVVAGLRADPAQARGLDALLLESTRSPVGRVLVALAAAGFTVFAVYSLLEARYRAVSAGA
jgi:hypothetical protein